LKRLRKILGFQYDKAGEWVSWGWGEMESLFVWRFLFLFFGWREGGILIVLNFRGASL
jgi:hypothetical protein